MYKLVCRSLSRSNKALTNYTSIYRKITQHNASHNHNKSSKPTPQSQPEFKNEDAWEEVPDTPQKMQTKSISSFFSRKYNMKTLKSFPGRTQFSMLSTSSRKHFYSSNIELGKNKSKTTGVAVNYYNDGTNQCNKIRNKYKKISSNTKWSWTPQPFKGKVDTSLHFVKAERFSTPQPRAINLNKYQEDPVDDLNSLTNDPLPKIILRRRNYQNVPDKKKFKIVYPTNAMKYRMGFYPVSNRNKRYKSFAQEKERNPGVPTVQQKPKKKVPPPKLLPIVEFAPPAYINRIQQTVSSGMNKFSQGLSKADEPTRLITAHPVLKKANYQNKMSIKKKYNLLLLKQSIKVPIKKKQLPVEHFKTEEDQSVDRKLQEDNTTIESGEITKSDLQSCILQHPLSNLPLDKEFNTALKYPKRVVSEKNEFFDVDDICLKTKEKYYLPSDPVIATIKTKTTSEISESRNVGALPEMYSSIAVPSKRKQIVQKKTLGTNETNTSLQESKTSKEFSMKNLNTSRPIHAAKPLVDYLNTLNGLKEKTPLNRSSYKKMKKKIQMVQEVKFDKNGTMEEKYNSNYVSVDCTGAAFQAPAGRQQKNILKEVSKQMTVNLEKQIENLSKNLLPSQPELIATTNDELIPKETQQFKSRASDSLDTDGPKDILRGCDEIPPIAKAVRYSEQLQRILNQYKYDGYVSEQGISKCDKNTPQIQCKEPKSEVEIIEVQTKLEVVNKGIPNVKHEALYSMDTKLPPLRKITGEKLEQTSNQRNTDQDGTVVKNMIDISSTKHVAADFKKHHIKSRQDSSSPSGNLLINHKKANWKEMKEQLKKISLVEKIEGTQVIKRGESLNAHSTNVSGGKIIKPPDTDKTENKICTKFARYLLKENDDFQTDQMSRAKELKKNDGPSEKSKLSNQVKYQKINEVQIKNELEERLQKLKLIIDNKSRNRQNQRMSTERNNNDQNNVKADFSENTLSLDMYDSRAEPLPQRPVIRKEKPPISEKKEKQKSKNPIILPPQQGSSEKKLDGTLIFSKNMSRNESAGEYTDSKDESNTENERKSDIPIVIQPSKNHEKLEIEVEDIQLYRPRYRISQEVKFDDDNVINLDDSRSVVEIKSLPESETVKETEEEGTSKVIIKPFPDNLIRKTVNEKKSHILNDSNTTFKFTSKTEKASRHSMLSKKAFTPNYKKTLVGEIQNNLKLDWDTTIEDALNESIWEEVSNLKRDILRPILTKNDVSTVYKKRFANKCVEVTNDNLWKSIQNYTKDSHNNSRNTVKSDIQFVKDYGTNKNKKQNLDRQCITEFDNIINQAPRPKKLNIYFKKLSAPENLRTIENEQNSIYKEVLQHNIDNVPHNIGEKNLLENQLNIGIGEVENKWRKKETQKRFIGQTELGKDNRGFKRNTQDEKSVANLNQEIFIRKSHAANKGKEGNQSLRTCGDSTIWKSESSLSYKSANNFSNPIEALTTKKNMNIDINSFNEKQYRIHFPTESLVVQNLPGEKVVSEEVSAKNRKYQELGKDKYNKKHKFPESASENTIKLSFHSPSPKDEASDKSVKLNYQAKTLDFDSSKPSFSPHFYYTNEFKTKRPLSMNDFRTSSSKEKSSRKTKVDLNIDNLKRHNDNFNNFMNSRGEKINRHDGSSSQTKTVVYFTYKKSKMDGNHLSLSSNLENFGNEIYGKHLNTYEKQDSRTYKVNYKKSDIDYSKPIISNNSKRNKIMMEDSSGRQLNVNPKANRIETYNKAKLSTFNQNVHQLKNIYYLHDNDCRKMTAQLIEELQRNYKKKLVMESRKTMSNSQIAQTNSSTKKRTNTKHRDRYLKKQYSHRPQTAPATKVSSVAPRLRLLTINTLNGCEKVGKQSKRIPEQLSKSKFTQEHLDFSVKPEAKKTSRKRVKRSNLHEQNEIKLTKPHLFEIPQRPQTEPLMNQNDFPGFNSKTSNTVNYKNRRFQEYKPQKNEVVEANVSAPKNIHRLIFDEPEHKTVVIKSEQFKACHLDTAGVIKESELQSKYRCRKSNAISGKESSNKTVAHTSLGKEMTHDISKSESGLRRKKTEFYVQGNNHTLITEHTHKQLGAKKNNLEVLVKEEICPDCFPKKKKKSDEDRQNEKKRERNSKNEPQKVVVKLDKKNNNEHQLYQLESFQKNSNTEKSKEGKKIVVEQGSVDNNSKNIVVNLILPKAMKNLENHENDIICKPRNITPRETDNAATALSIPAEEEFTWKNDRKIFVNLFIPKSNHKALKQHKSIPNSKTENNVLQATTEHVLPDNTNDDLRKKHTNEANEKPNKSTQKVESNYNQSDKRKYQEDMKTEVKYGSPEYLAKWERKHLVYSNDAIVNTPSVGRIYVEKDVTIDRRKNEDAKLNFENSTTNISNRLCNKSKTIRQATLPISISNETTVNTIELSNRQVESSTSPASNENPHEKQTVPLPIILKNEFSSHTSKVPETANQELMNYRYNQLKKSWQQFISKEKENMHLHNEKMATLNDKPQDFSNKVLVNEKWISDMLRDQKHVPLNNIKIILDILNALDAKIHKQKFEKSQDTDLKDPKKPNN